MSGLIERLSEETRLQNLQVEDRSIGKILLEGGKLRPGDAERALRLQKEKGLRFGEACIQLKLVTQDDIESALSHQFNYPYLRAGDANLSRELTAAYDPFSAHVEALRALRTQLLLRWFNQERKAIAVVSPDRGDGRSYLIANLAIVFSQLGEKTLLIDADMRHARQHELFRLNNQYGLSSVLTGRAKGREISLVNGFANLAVLTAGSGPPNPLELVSRPEFAQLVAAEAHKFDVVLLDTPAAETGSDAQAIAACAGGALIVARQDKSRFASLRNVVDSLQGTHTEIVGSVLNKF